MRRISVPEYGRIPVSDLSPDELRRLRAFDEYRGASVPSVFDWRFRQYIRPLNLVGVVQVPGLQIEILPKIDGVATATSTWHTDDPVCRTAQSNLLFMLRYAKRIRLLDADLSALRLQNMSLLDMLVHLFIQRTAEELQRGLDHGYIYQEECLSVLRGKLLFSQQVKQNVVNAARFHVRYDEYIPDTWMNRILKAACRLLFGSVSSGSLRRRLLELLQHLSAVSDMPVTQEHFQQIRWNRNNERLRPCVEFARMVLTQRSPSPARGATETFSLLFPMDALFEEFVAGFIMRHSADLGLRRDRIRVQATGSRRCSLLPLRLITSAPRSGPLERTGLQIDRPVRLAPVHEELGLSPQHLPLRKVFPQHGVVEQPRDTVPSDRQDPRFHNRHASPALMPRSGRDQGSALDPPHRLKAGGAPAFDSSTGAGSFATHFASAPSAPSAAPCQWNSGTVSQWNHCSE